MKLSGKVIATVIIVILLGGFLLMVQRSSSSPTPYRLNAHEMEVLVNEVLPAGQREQLATNDEQKKELAKQLKQLLALAQVAEQEGFLEHADVKSEVDIQTDLVLRDAYEKKNTDVKVTDEEVTAYNNQHPTEWSTFLESNPQFKAQAQGPQGEQIKNEFGKIKMLAERARKQGLQDEEANKIKTMLGRGQALARAYVADLQKNSEKLMKDGDVEQYYKEHPEEFEEVQSRHILISTQPPPDAQASPGEKADKDKPKAKPLTEDEARKKAQAILDRLRKGEDFAKLAEENSDDPGSKIKGGDLGFNTKGAMVPQFDDALAKLKDGETSDLVVSQFGVHIIKREHTRTKPLDDPQAKQQITEKVKQDKLQKHIEDIAARSKVEVAEDFAVTAKPAAQPEVISPAGPGGMPENQSPNAR